MRAVGPALSSVSKDSLSGRGQPTGNLCPSSSPASWPRKPQGCCFLLSCALARPDPSLRPPFQFCRSSVLCWPPVILLASPGSWCWAGGSIPERGAPGLSAGGVRGSLAFTCTMLYVKALLPNLYHTAQLPPRIIVPTTRQACPTVNSAPTLSTW